ncbi:hypothetical protein GCM10009557_45280 [Virgisporangium ochraceum]|uniref:Uncharacterized protein n=1 Tax=Virgisporangium ochraceum TaxID=65505 RepID=A0A8J3ZQ47_9ACTN|nr:hypothetical protein [Virgisporangium ochraceum]GIJ67741.1 hypothetical protein Voc01_026580 [Virgisporangium ochraceum]
MRIDVSIPDTDDAEPVQSFFGWITADTELAGSIDVTRSSSAPGHMGALDIINVTLTHLVAISNLAMVYAAWRRSRPEVPTVVFRVGAVTVTASDASPETLDRLCETLRTALDTDDAS